MATVLASTLYPPMSKIRTSRLGSSESCRNIVIAMGKLPGADVSSPLTTTAWFELNRIVSYTLPDSGKSTGNSGRA